MYLVASVRLSVSQRSHGSALPSAAKRSHYQSKVFVCVSKNRADAVDRLLIINCYSTHNNKADVNSIHNHD